MASSTQDDVSFESRMADSNETDRDSLDNDAEDGPQAELIGTVELSFASSTRQRQWDPEPSAGNLFLHSVIVLLVSVSLCCVAKLDSCSCH